MIKKDNHRISITLTPDDYLVLGKLISLYGTSNKSRIIKKALVSAYIHETIKRGLKNDD